MKTTIMRATKLCCLLTQTRNMMKRRKSLSTSTAKCVCVWFCECGRVFLLQSSMSSSLPGFSNNWMLPLLQTSILCRFCLVALSRPHAPCQDLIVDEEDRMRLDSMKELDREQVCVPSACCPRASFVLRIVFAPHINALASSCSCALGT